MDGGTGLDVSASACSAALKATGKCGIRWRRLTSFANAIVLSINASSSCCKFIMRGPLRPIIAQSGENARGYFATLRQIRLRACEGLATESYVTVRFRL